MTPRSHRPDAAELGHRVWDHLRGRATQFPDEFTPVTHDDVTGWLWEGAVAALIREAIPGIGENDLRRAREYLNATGMVVHARGHQRSGQPQWFIRSEWHHGPGGHVYVVTAHRPGGVPAAEEPAPTTEPGEQARQPSQDIVTALQSLAQQVAELQSDNDRLRSDNKRLRSDNDRLNTEIARVQALMHKIGGEITQQASQLLTGTPTRS